jgi:hypothetical protein
MDEAEDSKDYEYENIKAKFPEISFRNDIVENSDNSTKKRKTMDEIMNDLNLGEEDAGLIRSGSRKRCLVSIKLQFINEALNHKYTHKEIGHFIGISQSAVTKLLNNS